MILVTNWVMKPTCYLISPWLTTNARGLLPHRKCPNPAFKKIQNKYRNSIHTAFPVPLRGSSFGMSCYFPLK